MRLEAIGYTSRDLERFVPEIRTSASRSEFARDRARVVHSSALRRLGAKTQVLSPTNGGDFARTRLTHTLEVAQIGREMALDLGLDPDIVDMAALAHDLGHPPFGHNGETALNEWAREFGGFEGNAQTLRLLTRIEPKVFVDGTSRGLNLTRASLNATCKYPWGKSIADDLQTSKFGVYPDDAEIFDWMRAGDTSTRKSIEAQVMDFADDVAYSVHDFEDAIVGRYLSLDLLSNSINLDDLLIKVQAWTTGFSTDELADALNRLSTSNYWLDSFDLAPSSLGRLKNLASELIGRFVSAAVSATVSANLGKQIRIEGDLVIPRQIEAEIAVLKGIVSAVLMTASERQPYYDWQRALLIELADALLHQSGRHLDAYCTGAWQQAIDEIQQRRVIVDQIACLTDQSAITMHANLVPAKHLG